MDISKFSGLGSTSGRSTPAHKPDRQKPDRQPSDRQPSDRQPSDRQPETSGRSLVPIAPSQPESSLHRSARPSPAFLAQLIATARHAPQTRARGRIAPADAIARYTGAPGVRAPTRNWDWSV